MNHPAMNHMSSVKQEDCKKEDCWSNKDIIEQTSASKTSYLGLYLRFCHYINDNIALEIFMGKGSYQSQKKPREWHRTEIISKQVMLK